MTTPQLDHHSLSRSDSHHHYHYHYHYHHHHHYRHLLLGQSQSHGDHQREPDVPSGPDPDFDAGLEEWEHLFVMDKFARSLKSPPYLSPRLRPSMPGRTLSSSSDKSTGDDFGDLLLLSGRNTPTLPGVCEPATTTPADGYFGSEDAFSGQQRGGRTGVWEDHDATPATSPGPSPASSSTSSRPRRSRPIAIEVPRAKRFNTSSIRTPPPHEPLSARGDLPGGYFPLHEDPSARIHRPHPFHYDHKMTRHQHSSLIVESSPMLVERATAASYPAQDLSLAQSHTPVTSYLPSGFHDSPLPMGKYYPSNWEQRNNSNNSSNNTTATTNKAGQSSPRSSVSGALPSVIKSDSQVPLRHADGSLRGTVESEVRRRLLQYQRDMMTQASMAASEIKPTPSGIRSRPSGLSLNTLPIPEMRFNAPASHKPRTPNLLPLGSPGPVTPMDLESTGRDYLDRPDCDEAPVSDGLLPPAIQLATHST